MAGEWIKWCVGLPNKTEVLAMADLLGMDRYAIAGRLINEVWAWAREQTPDGILRHAQSVTVRAHIDALAGAKGFADAMEKVGWLCIEDGIVWFPNWEDHLSNSAKQRALASRRAARSRSRKSNARSVTKAHQRREEKSIDGDGTRCARTVRAPAVAAQQRPSPSTPSAQPKPVGETKQFSNTVSPASERRSARADVDGDGAGCARDGRALLNELARIFGASILSMSEKQERLTRRLCDRIVHEGEQVPALEDARAKVADSTLRKPWAAWLAAWKGGA